MSVNYSKGLVVGANIVATLNAINGEKGVITGVGGASRQTRRFVQLDNATLQRSHGIV